MTRSPFLARTTGSSTRSPAAFYRSAALPIALALSGGGALAVEVLWQQQLVRLLGGSTASLTAVLAAYMGGLAFGAALAGAWADRLAPSAALKVYVRLEVLITVAAAVVTLVLAQLPAGFGALFAIAPEGELRNLLRVLFAVCVLLVPTTAMGATLPLAVRAMAGGGGGGLLSASATLYAMNTAGAVLGSLAAPFVLLPFLGLWRAAIAACVGNLIAAFVARGAMTARDDAMVSAPECASDVDRPSIAPISAAVLVAFMTGATALAFEILWTRSLTHHMASSVHAFSAVLALVLGGIVVGSALAPLAARFGASAACAVLTMVGAAIAVAVFGLPDGVPERMSQLAQAGKLDLNSSLKVLLGVGLATIGPPAMCFGAAFPLVIQVIRRGGRNSDTARAVGQAYAANTIGAIVGVTATGLLLLPSMGRYLSAQFLAAIAVLSVIPLLWLGTRGRTQARVVACLLLIAAGAAVALSPTHGVLGGSSHERAVRWLGSGGSATGNRPLYFAEGPEASVAVEVDGMRRAFYVAGRPEASNGPRDMRNQFLLGHLPALLSGGQRGSTRSLVVGLGSGMTAGALLDYGEVTIAELNSAVPGAARFFADLNHDVVNRARIRIEDGRVVLAEHGPTYHVITTDPIHPSVAGSALLYTSEHFGMCRRRLAPNGAVSVWLPLFSMGAAELRAIIGSFVDQFRDAELYLLSAGDAVLLGGGMPRDARGGVEWLHRGWAKTVRDDMRLALLESPDEVAALRVAGPDELSRFAAGARRNRDDDPWIELSLPKFRYMDTVQQNVRDLLALRTGPAAESPLARQHATVLHSYLLARQRKHREALAVLEAANRAGLPRTLESRTVLRDVSESVARDDLAAGRIVQAIDRARAEVFHADAHLRSLYNAAWVLQRTQQWDALEALAERLTRDWPDQPEGLQVLAEALLGQGRFGEAEKVLERALKLDRYAGYSSRTLAMLGRIQLLDGRVDEGRTTLLRSLDQRPSQPELEMLLKASASRARELARDQLLSPYQ